MSTITANIKTKRGNKSDLPTLSLGEQGFCNDTKELFIGHSEGNKLLTFPAYNLSNFCVGDGITDNRTAILNLIALIGSSKANIIVDNGSFAFSGSLTFPNNISFTFLLGGILKVAVGNTLTINGNISAGIFQIFDGDGSINGTFKGNIFPEWFGALGDGITQDTISIQKAIDTAYNKGGAIVELQACTYLKGTIIIKNNVSLLGKGIRATKLKQYGVGNCITIQDDFSSTIVAINIQDMTIEGITTDGTNNAIYGSTPYGISHSNFKNLFINKIGANGLHFSHTGTQWWMQYCLFENIFIGDLISPNDACQGYPIYAFGGFSTNVFKLIRCHNNPKGVYISGDSVSLISVEDITFDTCNIQNVNTGNDSIQHGIYLNYYQGITLINCYIEIISPNDTSHTSSAVYSDNVSSRNLNILGGLYGGFYIGIHLYKGAGAFINGACYLWNGTTPVSNVDSFIKIGTNFGVYSANIGINSLFAGSSDLTYVSDSGNRAIGFLANDGKPFFPRIAINQKIFRSDSAAPVSGTFSQGDTYFNNSPDPGESVGWVCTSGGTPGTWTPFGQVGYRSRAGSPSGVFTPNFVGEEVFDSTNVQWYKSTGTNNTDWKQIT